MLIFVIFVFCLLVVHSLTTGSLLQTGYTEVAQSIVAYCHYKKA